MQVNYIDCKSIIKLLITLLHREQMFDTYIVIFGSTLFHVLQIQKSSFMHSFKIIMIQMISNIFLFHFTFFL